MVDWISVAAFAGVLVGALIAGLFSLLAPKLQSQRDHARWLREARLTAYSDYLSAMDLWMDASTTRWLEDHLNGIEQPATRATSLEDEVSRHQSKVYILGPDPVRLVAAEYHHLVLDHILSIQSVQSLEAAVAVDVAHLSEVRGTLLAIMNRVLGIRLV